MEIRIIEDEKKGQAPKALVVVKGLHISSFDVKLPDMPIDKLLPLLPSLMQDYCAEDVSELHFSVVPQQDGRKIILCCHRDVMEALRSICTGRLLHLYAVWPDYMAVPVPENGLNIYQDQKYSYIRQANGQGITVPLGQEDIFLPNQEEANTTSVTHVALSDFPAGQGLVVGDYAQPQPIFAHLKSLKRFAMWWLPCCLLYFILGWLVISELKSETDAHNQATVQLFKQAFPDVKRIVNVESQARTLIRQQQETKADYFTTFSQSLFETVKTSTIIQLESMSYEVTQTGPILTILVKSSGFEQLETFKNSLARQNMRVIDQGSEQQKNGVFATLLIQQGDM